MSSARDRKYPLKLRSLHVARAHYSTTGDLGLWEDNFRRLRLDRKFGVVMEGHCSSTRSPRRATLEVSGSQRPKRYSPTAPTHAVGRQPLGLQLARLMHSRRHSCTRPMLFVFRLGVLGPSGSVLRRRPCTCWHNTIGICFQWTVPSATTRSGYYPYCAHWRHPLTRERES